MDSPPSGQPQQPQRIRPHSNTFSASSSGNPAGVRKRAFVRDRSISTTQVERLHQLALEQQQQQHHHHQVTATPAISSVLPASTGGTTWLTPQHSPQPHVYSEPTIEPFHPWTVPTPPRSDSGVPTLSVDSTDDPTVTTTCGPTSQSFNFALATTSAEMSSLGFLLPSQYGTGVYESEPTSYAMDQTYIPTMRMSEQQQQPATTATATIANPPPYTQAHTSSSPALYQSRNAPTSAARRHSELPHPTSTSEATRYSSSWRRTSNPYEPMPTSDYSMPIGQSIPPITGLTQSPVPSPSMGSGSAGAAALSAHYSQPYSRTSPMYDSTVYTQQPTALPTAAPPPLSAQHMYAAAAPSPNPGSGSSGMPSYPHPPLHPSTSSSTYLGNPHPPHQTAGELLAKPLGSGAGGGGDASIRVLNQRPRPQCWEHGCNGRQFSTFSNLLRHQREKSGSATKSYCPKCGAEFTRTTARNGHLAHDKCSKQRRESEDNK